MRLLAFGRGRKYKRSTSYLFRRNVSGITLRFVLFPSSSSRSTLSQSLCVDPKVRSHVLFTCEFVEVFRRSAATLFAYTPPSVWIVCVLGVIVATPIISDVHTPYRRTIVLRSNLHSWSTGLNHLRVFSSHHALQYCGILLWCISLRLGVSAASTFRRGTTVDM